MVIETNSNDGVLTVAPDGRLDSNTAGELDEVLEKNINESVKSLVIDMKKVDFVSSKGIRVLVGAYRKLGENSVTIFRANDSIKEIFRISGLMKIFNFE